MTGITFILSDIWVLCVPHLVLCSHHSVYTCLVQFQATLRNFSFLFLHHYKWNPLLQSIGPLQVQYSHFILPRAPEIFCHTDTYCTLSHIKHLNRFFKVTPLFVIVCLSIWESRTVKRGVCVCLYMRTIEREILNS